MFEKVSEPKAHPQGEFFGHIKSVNVARSANGLQYLLFKIKTNVGELSLGMYPQSQNVTARAIAQQNCKIIMQSYEDEPRGQFDFFTEMPAMMQGLPVLIYVKHKGRNDAGFMEYNIYFRPVPPRDRVSKKDGRIIERVQYSLTPTSN